jgi:small conductance mechanosensitive channel
MWQGFLTETLLPLGTDLVIKGGASLLFWMIGKRVIELALGLLERALSTQHVDATVKRYVTSTLRVALTVALAIAIFGYLGGETATFAALLAGAGLAIGTAWGDLLKNFASGVFMLVLRPFKVGDFVTAAGVTGTVVEMGIFATALDTPDNVRTLVGNSAIFGSTIQNFSHNAYRRVDLVAQLAGSADTAAVITTLRARLAAIPHVVASPAPEVFILTFNERGPVLCVRPFTHTDHYWQVYFDTNAAILAVGAELGLPVPTNPVRVVS